MSCVLFVGGRGAFDYDYDCERKCKLINACAQVKVPRSAYSRCRRFTPPRSTRAACMY